ncbi:MAG: polyprenyl synthetase family protein [Thermoflavifilum sp.]|nr:polyprenyl synthetase family protein [Thermoflavifilum sp.]
MQAIRKIIDVELQEFEAQFTEALRSRVPLLDRIMQYIVKHKGKQIRPMFVIFSARLAGPVNSTTYRAAALVELLHTATLVHDDVVDDAYERRGFFSINALWKNKIAVLVGDYLLSKGLLLSLDHGDYTILQILSDAVKRMSESELLQIEKTRYLNMEETVYFEIIRGKTASLLAAACSAGIYSVSQDPELTQKMKQFGEKVGIAFQIKDDLFDYGHAAIGKPIAHDIQEKKITLPLIYALHQASSAQRRRMIQLIKHNHQNKNKVQEIIQFVIDAGGIEYAHQQMLNYRNEAFQILNTFPDNPIRRGLEALVRFTTDREY